MSKIHLATQSACKVAAARKVLGDRVVPTAGCKSGVPEQPIDSEVRQGAMNRLKDLPAPAISFESGIIQGCECTIMALKLDSGVQIFTSTPFPIDPTLWERYIHAHPQRDVTFGSFAYPEAPTDWYVFVGQSSREEQLATLLKEVWDSEIA